MDRITIIHVPVIHQGYIDFFEKEDIKMVFILGEDFQKECAEKVSPAFGRDPRKLDPGDAWEFLNSKAGTQRKFSILNDISIISKFIKHDAELILPDEDVSHYLSETYLKEVAPKTRFVDTHLRWDMSRVYKDSPVDEDVLCTEDERSKLYMDKAKQVTQKSNDWWRQIGCVIVTAEGQEIVGYNRHPDNLGLEALGDPRSNFNAGVSFELSTAIHSEATAIAYAARYGIGLEGASIFVTTFPCPVCAKLIAESGIGEIYFEQGYSRLDGESILKQNKIKIYRVVSKIE